LAGLYGVLLWAVVTQITSRTPDALLLCWKSVCTFTGFMIVAALIGWALPKARPLWRTLQLDDERGPWGGAWFHVAQALIGLATAALTVWVAIDFRFDGVGEEFAVLGMTGRLTAMFAALMLLGASMLMAWQSDERWLRPWQYAAMASGVLLSSTFGWARLSSLPGTPSGDAPWLHRCALLMISSAMMTLMSSLGLAKTLPQQSTWPEAGRRAAPVFAVVALAMLALVLGQEVWFFAIGQRVLMADWAIIVVAVALVGLAAGGIVVAVSPQLEPLRLSERGRTVYVYAAEILLALVGLHVWLNKPEWFALGVVRQFWMLIAMTVAFAGAGLAEFFKRRSMPVLAEPLANTALLLPAVPAIAFWFMPQAMAETLFLGGQSPVVWLLMGVFYGALAVRRGSIPLAALALITGNTGLWVLWHRLGWQFLDRPQLWLIPIALCALVAEHFDRRRLNDAQRTALRYVALAVIYVSSTTEFWRAIGDTPRLALVLALVTIGLSVIGILAGILLRVRSFLYLGVTFLVIVLGRIIFFAAFKEGHMWVFWSCCLLLGAAIIALFAVFEKRRNDVLLAVERFKAWHE
jgi:hypothetical protein